MACVAISLTNVDLLFIGAKEIFFYEIIFEIQTRNIFANVICKMSVILSRLQWVRVSPLNYMWTGSNVFAESLWVAYWLSCTYILVSVHLIPGASFTDMAIASYHPGLIHFDLFLVTSTGSADAQLPPVWHHRHTQGFIPTGVFDRFLKIKY